MELINLALEAQIVRLNYGRIFEAILIKWNVVIKKIVSYNFTELLFG